MKGSTAQTILKSLKEIRLKGLLDQLSAESNGILLVEVCNYLLATNEVSETAMRERFKLTKGKYYYYIEVIGDNLLTYLQGKKAEIQLDQVYLQARELFLASELEAGLDLVKSGIKSALQTEDFELVIRFLDLLEMSRERPKIEIIDQASARELRKNLLSYEDLLDRAREVSCKPQAALRKVASSEMLNSELLLSPSQAKSKRAVLYYWKTRQFCCSILRDYEEAIICQQELLSHISSFPWTCLDFELSLAHETRILGQLLRLTGRTLEFQKLSTDFQAMPLKSNASIKERVFFQFPISIAAAIQFGNQAEAIQSSLDFLSILENLGTSLGPAYITENLFCCLVCAIATKNEQIRIKALFHLSHFGKPEFRPKFYPMYRFVEIMLLVEAMDWDDAMRQIRNFRTSSSIEEVSGLREILSFMMRMVGNWSQSAPNEAFRLDESALFELQSLTEGQDFVDFFDLPVWFESMRKGCPMMDIFHHRTVGGS